MYIYTNVYIYTYINIYIHIVHNFWNIYSWEFLCAPALSHDLYRNSQDSGHWEFWQESEPLLWPVNWIKILQSQLATQYTLYHECRTEFWHLWKESEPLLKPLNLIEILQSQLATQSTIHCESARHSIYHTLWADFWHFWEESEPLLYPVILIEFLQRQLATQFAIHHDYGADFREVVTGERVPTLRHEFDRNSWKSARYSIYCLQFFLI